MARKAPTSTSVSYCSIANFTGTLADMLSYVTMTVMRHHDKKQFGEKVFISSYISYKFITEVSQGGNSRQKSRNRSRFRGHKEMLLTSLLIMA